MIRQIFNIFSRKQKITILIVFLGLSTILAALETVGIGLIFPYLAMLTNQELINENTYIKSVFNFLGFDDTKLFLIFCGLGLLFLIITKNILYFTINYLQQNYFTKKSVYYASITFHEYLKRDYSFHLEHHKAVLQQNITDVYLGFFGYLSPFFQIITETTIVLFILILLFLSNPLVTLGTIFVIGIPALITSRIISRILIKISEKYYYLCRKSSKWMLEGLENIKEIIVMGRQISFSKNYYDSSEDLTQYRVKQMLIPLIPRLINETTLIGGLLLLSFVAIIYDTEFSELLPILGLFGASAYRLMGSINKIIDNKNKMSKIKFTSERVISDIKKSSKIDLLGEISNYKPTVSNGLAINDKLSFDNVSFHYNGVDTNAIDNISFTILKGQSVAFVGATGAGKTTLLDIIIGLFPPTGGAVLVDNKNIYDNIDLWRQSIGYIPQLIHLTDDTLKNNVAFGIPENFIDENAVNQAIEAAQLSAFVNQLPNGINTIIGEQGNRLSGGQRQRIAIARALYHDPDILVMDEATSALDKATENEITNSIKELQNNKTIIIVAHRLTTVKHCDCLFFLKDGKIADFGSYDELFDKNNSFRQMVGGEK